MRPSWHRAHGTGAFPASDLEALVSLSEPPHASIMTTEPHGLTSRIVHADRHRGVGHGGLHEPISTSVQFGYERTQDLIDVFQGKAKGAFNYGRQGTPSMAALEALITALEGGIGSVCFATGMAALSALFLTLLRAGDHV